MIENEKAQLFKRPYNVGNFKETRVSHLFLLLHTSVALVQFLGGEQSCRERCWKAQIVEAQAVVGFWCFCTRFCGSSFPCIADAGGADEDAKGWRLFACAIVVRDKVILALRVRVRM